MDTSDVNSCAYGSGAEQPGSSMKIAVRPAVTHCLKRMMCSSGVLLRASPGRSWLPSIVCENEVSYGAKSDVTYPPSPTGGRPHAHVTKPEQSDRYAFHAALLSRSQRWLEPSQAQHDES